ncbi:MAG: hypothetical protein AB1480_13955 [Nitrospirota bacterium]
MIIKTFGSWNSHSIAWRSNNELIWVDELNSNRMYILNVDTLVETDLGINGNHPYVGAPSFTLTVNGSGTGSGTIRDQDTGGTKINCTITNGTAGGDCTEIYDAGTPVILTGNAAQGSVFSNWSGSGCSGPVTCTVTKTECTCTVTVDADKSVTATFTKK